MVASSSSGSSNSAEMANPNRSERTSAPAGTASNGNGKSDEYSLCDSSVGFICSGFICNIECKRLCTLGSSFLLNPFIYLDLEHLDIFSNGTSNGI